MLHGKQRDLEEENSALRRELAEQWWQNHAEHCGLDWPHPDGAPCGWRPPKLLEGEEVPPWVGKLLDSCRLVNEDIIE